MAIGKPVALEASAELRETRGFISMTTNSPESGFTANCTLEPPVSTPILRMIALAASRNSWYWPSVRVSAGATVTLSPVCTPMGSTFSMEQMITTLSARSRMTSSSNSCQPATDSSSMTWWIGLSRRPFSEMRRKPSRSWAMPPPAPPMVKAGRTTSGRPRSLAARSTSAGLVAMTLRGTRRPISSMAVRNSERSSARRMASASAPIISTSQRSRMPLSLSSIARLRAVWPPRVGSRASGRSISMMRVSVGRSRGSM